MSPARSFKTALCVAAFAAVVVVLTTPLVAVTKVPDPSPYGGATVTELAVGLSPEEIREAKMRVPAASIPELRDALARPTTTSSPKNPASAGCFFAADGDHVHRSGGYASGHGFWRNYTCPRGTRANVKVWLLEKLGGTWYVQGNPGYGASRLPGSGSAQRVTAKMRCVNSSSHQWRSMISVDLVGRRDTSPVASTPVRTIACY